MRVIADLHVHSKYAMACTKNIDIANLEKYARIKGLGVLGTGDFTHPLWNKELKDGLVEEGGVLKTKTGFPFILQTEISTIFTQGGKGRRVHTLVLAPDFETVDQIIDVLGKRGRLNADGRPILGMSCIELVELLKGVSKDVEAIPAHAWTPWFAIFGSKSGFDSIKECFGDQAKHIHAIETGLSSDPAMNWRLSQLDGLQLVSFSDMHSFWPHRIGRESTVFEVNELNYANILNAIRTGEGLEETIEVDPAYGKYHWDGHRACNVVLSPKEAEKIRNICPVCKRELTIGVEHRVEELADRSSGEKPPAGAKPFKSLIPLSEILGIIMGSQPFSKKVWEEYHKLIKGFGNEFNILLEAEREKLGGVAGKGIAQAIVDVREGKIKIQAGYDGVYGQPVFGEGVVAAAERQVAVPGPEKKPGGQKTLGEF